MPNYTVHVITSKAQRIVIWSHVLFYMSLKYTSLMVYLGTNYKQNTEQGEASATSNIDNNNHSDSTPKPPKRKFSTTKFINKDQDSIQPKTLKSYRETDNYSYNHVYICRITVYA